MKLMEWGMRKRGMEIWDHLSVRIVVKSIMQQLMTIQTHRYMLQKKESTHRLYLTRKEEKEA